MSDRQNQTKLTAWNKNLKIVSTFFKNLNTVDGKSTNQRSNVSVC